MQELLFPDFGFRAGIAIQRLGDCRSSISIRNEFRFRLAVADGSRCVLLPFALAATSRSFLGMSGLIATAQTVASFTFMIVAVQSSRVSGSSVGRVPRDQQASGESH
jgi:hypothetical protein